MRRRRYLAIRSLNLEEVNCKRAVLLARHFIREGRIPTVAQLSAEEPVLLPVELVAPRLHIGCRPEEALPALARGGEGGGGIELRPLRWGAELAASARGGASPSGNGGSANGAHANGSGNGSGGAAGAMRSYELAGGDVPCEASAQLYENERYVLTVRKRSVYIALREDAAAADILKAVWQAVTLEAGAMTPEQSLAAANDAETGGRAFAARVVEAGWKPEMLLKELDGRQRFRVEGRLRQEGAPTGPAGAR